MRRPSCGPVGAGTTAAAANNAAVRNRGLHEQLHAFACAASERLAGRLESGAEIPYEVAESPGARSVLYRYKPLSDDFVRERFPELRALPTFPEALAALSRIEGVSGYLRVMGASYVPASERDRAEAALERFLGRVWDEATSFDLDGGALRPCLSGARVRRLRGHGRQHRAGAAAGRDARVGALGPRVRGDRWCAAICPSAPAGRLGIRPQGRGAEHAVVLTVESRPTQPPPLTEARIAFRRLVTALRLLKPGGAALSSARAWWRTDDGPWQGAARLVRPLARRAATGSSSPSAPELVELFELARSAPGPGGALPWALTRFELGCEQPRCAGRAVRPPARDAGAAGPRRPIARRTCASPGGAVRRAGSSRRRRRAASSRRSGSSGW